MRKLLMGGLMVIGILFGVLIGAVYSYGTALNWCVDKGFRFLELKNITLDVNRELLKNTINAYSTRGDFPLPGFQGNN